MQKFIEKVGMDKVAHFGVGGLIAFAFTLVFILQDMASLIFTPWRAMLYPFIGTAITAVASIFKEMFLDERRDWNDLWASLAGCVVAFVTVLFGTLFFIGTNNLQ